VAHRIVSETDAGEIILAHDIHGPTIAAMPRALDGLLSKGYRFVTVSQLISIERRQVVKAKEPREFYDFENS
jgi:peptidoglycan/xylan/chitin deacetylase (PgdA/CDA1 family)